MQCSIPSSGLCQSNGAITDTDIEEHSHSHRHESQAMQCHTQPHGGTKAIMSTERMSAQRNMASD